MLSLRVLSPRSKSPNITITNTAPTRRRRFFAKVPFITDANDDDENKSIHNKMNTSELTNAVQLPVVDASLQTEQELDNTTMTPTFSSSSSPLSPGVVGVVIIILMGSLIQAAAMVNKPGRQYLPEWLRLPGDVVFWSLFVMVAIVLPFR